MRIVLREAKVAVSPHFLVFLPKQIHILKKTQHKKTLSYQKAFFLLLYTRFLF